MFGNSITCISLKCIAAHQIRSSNSADMYMCVYKYGNFFVSPSFCLAMLLFFSRRWCIFLSFVSAWKSILSWCETISHDGKNVSNYKTYENEYHLRAVCRLMKKNDPLRYTHKPSSSGWHHVYCYKCDSSTVTTKLFHTYFWMHFVFGRDTKRYRGSGHSISTSTKQRKYLHTLRLPHNLLSDKVDTCPKAGYKQKKWVSERDKTKRRKAMFIEICIETQYHFRSEQKEW